MEQVKSGACLPDIQINIWQAARPDAGEDCRCYCFSRDAGLVGVFDGCGGAGSKRPSCYSGKTEAYMASRLCAGAFYDSFFSFFPNQGSCAAQLQNYLKHAIRQCADTLKTYAPKDESLIKGSMIRSLPTTAAVMIAQPDTEGYLLTTALWVGDSRCFLLTPKGLAQLSVDDTTVPDPMENSYEDGVLTNNISAGKEINPHLKQVRCKPPFLMLTATDGCFGYFSTPMEFEGALLETMLAASTPDEWEQTLQQTLGSVAGDDYTLSLAGYGFETYADLKRCFGKRMEHLQENYLSVVRSLPIADRDSRRALWNTYRETYLRCMKEQ